MNIPKLMRHGVRVEGRSVPFYIREGSVADSCVLKQVFSSKDYKVEDWVQGQALVKFYEKQISIGLRPLIIDAGANIGAASLYFSVRYPQATVFAIEPDANNCDVLRRNTESRDVRLFCGALSSTDEGVYLNDPGLGEWGYRAAKDVIGIAVPSVSVSSILSNENFSPLIAKIDIEGAEKEVFSNNVDWLNIFPLVVVEIHDWMLPFSGVSKPLFKEIAKHNFDVIYRGENIFFFNCDILKNMV